MPSTTQHRPVNGAGHPLCMCGCGHGVKKDVNMFLQGHDAKLRSLVGKVARGETPQSKIPKYVDKTLLRSAARHIGRKSAH